MRHPGRHFLRIPEPSAIPDRILQVFAMPVADHRKLANADLGNRVLSGKQSIFKTEQPVVIYPAPGTGAWEAALVSTLSYGDKVLMVETGHFAFLWQQLARVPHQEGGAQAAHDYLKSTR